MSDVKLRSTDINKIDQCAALLGEVADVAGLVIVKGLKSITDHCVKDGMTRIFGEEDNWVNHAGQDIRATQDALRHAVKEAVHSTVASMEEACGGGFLIPQRAHDDTQYHLHVTNLSDRYWKTINS